MIKKNSPQLGEKKMLIEEITDDKEEKEARKSTQGEDEEEAEEVPYTDMEELD